MRAKQEEEEEEEEEEDGEDNFGALMVHCLHHQLNMQHPQHREDREKTRQSVIDHRGRFAEVHQLHAELDHSELDEVLSSCLDEFWIGDWWEDDDGHVLDAFLEVHSFSPFATSYVVSRVRGTTLRECLEKSYANLLGRAALGKRRNLE